MKTFVIVLAGELPDGLEPAQAAQALLPAVSTSVLLTAQMRGTIVHVVDDDAKAALERVGRALASKIARVP